MKGAGRWLTAGLNEGSSRVVEDVFFDLIEHVDIAVDVASGDDFVECCDGVFCDVVEGLVGDVCHLRPPFFLFCWFLLS